MSSTGNDTEEKKPNVYPPDVLQRWLNKNKPLDLFLKLRGKVYGQDEELQKAAVLIYGFLQTVYSGRTDPKFHFLIEGKSGSGKTTFATALREILPCPVMIADSSQLTPAGFKGAEAADFVNSQELRDWYGCGVVILDELDKVMQPIASSTDDNFHRQALENLLKMLDGGSIYDRNGESVDCSRILFIGMGAFTPLQQEGQLEKRTIGFISDEISIPQKESLSKETMSAFCGSEQLMGRFITILHFQSLGRELYKKIITKTELEISRLFGNFCIPPEEEERIINDAVDSEFGCRSIKTAIWEAFLGQKTVITESDLMALRILESNSDTYA